MSTLKERLQEAMKAAMRAKEKQRLGTIRFVQAGIKRREVDERIELDDAGGLAVIEKLLKQSRDSLAQYREAGREDLAAKEEADIAVYEEFMPAPYSEEELEEFVAAAVEEAGASSPRDMGAVMKLLKPRIQGRADMGAVSALVRARLSSS